jgi:hypothetical protein
MTDLPKTDPQGMSTQIAEGNRTQTYVSELI